MKIRGNQLLCRIKHPIISLCSKLLPLLYLFFHNACPRHLKSRRDLLYLLLFLQMFCFMLLYNRLCLSIQPLFILLYFCCLWPHCCCTNAVVISNTASAHLHATAVAVYLALFSNEPLSTFYDLVKIQQ